MLAHGTAIQQMLYKYCDTIMDAYEIKFGSITIDVENNRVTVLLSQDGTVWMTQSEFLWQPSAAIFVRSTSQSK